MKMRLFFLYFFLLSMSALAQNADVISIYNSANEAYSKGEYGNAGELYQQVLAQGVHSADLYYNLGNADFKSGKIASAILYFEKALKLDPSHEDAQFNLKLANTKIADKIESIPELPIFLWWKNMIFSMPSDSLASIGLLGLFAACLSFILFMIMRRMYLKKIFFYLGCVIILTGGFLLFFAHQQKSYITESSYAIVFSSGTTVRSAPDETGTKLFIIHEGTKVEVLEELSQWSKIKIANGNVGWLKSEGLKGI
jgi:tetratricopeptide (TPR) repeat protein